MTIGFESPCCLVNVEYLLHKGIGMTAIIGVIVYARRTKRHKYKPYYQQTSWSSDPINDLSSMSETERAALAELPFSKDGLTPDIKARVIKTIKEHLTIV